MYLQLAEVLDDVRVVRRYRPRETAFSGVSSLAKLSLIQHTTVMASEAPWMRKGFWDN